MIFDKDLLWLSMKVLWCKIVPAQTGDLTMPTSDARAYRSVMGDATAEYRSRMKASTVFDSLKVILTTSP